MSHPLLQNGLPAFDAMLREHAAPAVCAQLDAFAEFRARKPDIHPLFRRFGIAA